ncbi:hypothetical protein ACK8GG_02170 [Micromonosporaceae bacterium DT55]|uniref:hypothetical protein n=2 Tax=Melissospora conviva TaxID=3388432 RepID=UPI003C2209CF
MMESLHRLAARLDRAAATVAAISYAVPGADPPHPAFGADANGRAGELGRALHRQWRQASDARAREAAEAAARLAATADAVRAAAGNYADIDELALHRQRRET